MTTTIVRSPAALRFVSFLVHGLIAAAGLYTCYSAWHEEKHTRHGATCQLNKEQPQHPTCELIDGDDDDHFVPLWNATTLLICLWMILVGLAGAGMEILNSQTMARRWFFFFFAGTLATARGIDVRGDDVIMIVAGAVALAYSFVVLAVWGFLRDTAAVKVGRNQDEERDGMDANPFLLQGEE
jgi:hypothetical protein